MGGTTKGSKADKAKENETTDTAETVADTFDGAPNETVSGGADDTLMVGFHANVRVSGPGYVIEADDSGLIPAEYAKAHSVSGHGDIVA